jgi:hypothetical protein
MSHRKQLPPERVKVADAIAITGLGQRKLQQMAAAGQVPGAARPPTFRVWTFDLVELRAWVANWDVPRAATAPRPRAHIGTVPGADISDTYERAKERLRAVMCPTRERRHRP